MRCPVILDRLQIGDHVCVPVYGIGEQYTAAAAYTAGGIREGHKTLLLVDDPPGIREFLLARLPGAGAALTRGQVQIRPAQATYRAGGGFDAVRMLNTLITEIDLAGGQGYPGLRVAGTLTSTAGMDDHALVDYEARVNALLADQPFIGLCHYDPRTLDPVTWQRLAQLHPSTLTSVDDDAGIWLRCRRIPDGVRLAGEADLTNRAALPNLLTPLVTWPGTCHIDVTGLRFADIHAGWCLLRAVAARSGQATTITGTPHLARLLTLLGAATVPGLDLIVTERR
jgi:hypothetical protein